jgi:hypothetical protein
VIVRELFLKGSGVSSFGLEILGLGIIGPVAILLAALRFSKRVR